MPEIRTFDLVTERPIADFQSFVELLNQTKPDLHLIPAKVDGTQLKYLPEQPKIVAEKCTAVLLSDNQGPYIKVYCWIEKSDNGPGSAILIFRRLFGSDYLITRNFL